MALAMPPMEATRVGLTVADAQQQERRVASPSHLDFGTLSVTLMSSRGASNASAEREQEFNTLANQWREETGHLSLARDKANNFFYHQIMAMGEDALPLILRNLQTRTTDWFWALRAIARDRAPQIPPKVQGQVRQIADIWIQWGKDNGYISG